MSGRKDSPVRLTALDVSANRLLEVLRCGNQTSDGTTPQTLMLTLTADQKTVWDTEWQRDTDNTNVNALVAE